MAAITLPAPEDVVRTAAQNRRTLLLIGLSLIVVTFANDLNLATLPLRFLLKDRLHLGATAVSGFFALTGLAWYFKPLAGMLSDSVPLWGTRRRSYLLASSIGAAGLWGLLAFVPQRYGPILWTMGAINGACVVGSSVAGGLLVEAGQRSGLTGRLSVLRQMILGGCGLLGGPVGGFLAARAFGWTCLTGAMLFLLLIPVVALLLPEPRGAQNRAAEVGANLKAQFRAMRQSRALWIAAAFIFMDQVSPGFGTPLFYVQTNALKFSSQFIGNLGLIGGLGGLVGVLLYGAVCGRIALRPLLTASIPLSALGSLLYLGYHSHGAALVIEPANAFLSAAVQIALMDLAARATPRGSEALCYSLLMSAFNLASAVSDLFGSWLYDKQHLPLSDLIWISAITSALPLLALPLIPRALMAQADGVPSD